MDHAIADNKLTAFLANNAAVSLLFAPERERDVLKSTDAAALTDSFKGTKRVTEVLIEAMKSASYIYDADFRNPEELGDACAGEEETESVKYLL